MRYSYKTKGVCTQKINFDINDNIITNIEFIGGCNGNLKAIAKLLDGKNVDYIYNTLKGNTCENRPTSCADQLAKAVKTASAEIK